MVTGLDPNAGVNVPGIQVTHGLAGLHRIWSEATQQATIPCHQKLGLWRDVRVVGGSPWAAVPTCDRFLTRRRLSRPSTTAICRVAGERDVAVAPSVGSPRGPPATVGVPVPQQLATRGRPSCPEAGLVAAAELAVFA